MMFLISSFLNACGKSFYRNKKLEQWISVLWKKVESIYYTPSYPFFTSQIAEGTYQTRNLAKESNKDFASVLAHLAQKSFDDAREISRASQEEWGGRNFKTFD